LQEVAILISKQISNLKIRPKIAFAANQVQLQNKSWKTNIQPTVPRSSFPKVKITPRQTFGVVSFSTATKYLLGTAL